MRRATCYYSTLFYAALILTAADAGAAILRSKIVDAKTNEPLEGAVVVVVWRRPVFIPCMDSCSKFHDAAETITDADGNFAIDISMGWLANERNIAIYKPGYYQPTYSDSRWLFLEKDPTPHESQTIRLKKAPSLSTQSNGYVSSFSVCDPEQYSGFCVPAHKVKRYIQLRELITRIQDVPFFPEQAPKLPELHAATTAADLTKVRTLIDQGMKPDMQDQHGRTALMFATWGIFRNRTQLRAWAERHRGPPSLRAEANKTYHDSSTRTEEIFRTLLAAGADPNAKSKTGETALAFAIPPRRLIVHTQGSRYPDLDLARMQSPELVKTLLSSGADPNARNNDGVTPLMFASSRGLGKIAEALLAHGADVNIKANFGVTAYDLAEGDEIINILRNARDFKRHSPR